MRRLTVVLVLVALLATACGGSEDPPPDDGGPQTPGSASQQAVPGAAQLQPLARAQVQVPAGLGAAPFNTARFLNIPGGWTASVHARIDKARFMTLTPNGELLVSQPSTGAVLIVRGVGQVSQFIGGLNRPHDMVFAELNGQTWLFIAEAHRVMRYPYAKGDVRAQQGQVAVDGLPDSSTPELRGQYAHVLKNIAVHNGVLYVSIASTCNACVEDTRSDPQRAAIYTYDAAGRNANRKLFATGLRNAEGLAFVPGTSQLWVVVNNRDNTLVPDDRDAASTAGRSATRTPTTVRATCRTTATTSSTATASGPTAARERRSMSGSRRTRRHSA
jgi:glucose/arabinose dehydrogenase